jgi:mono/diheme cytochrome c family protein
MMTKRSDSTRGGFAAALMVGLTAFAVATAVPAAEEKAPAVPEAAMKEAKEVYATRCSTCHGTGGKGDGAAAAALSPKPRDLTDAVWQKTLADDYVEKIIVQGGAGVGKSPLMPPNPDLADKPEVVKGLLVLVRGFAKGDAAKQ